MDIEFKSHDVKTDANQISVNTFWIVVLDTENYMAHIKPELIQWLSTLYTVSTQSALSDGNILTENSTNNLIIAVLLRCSSSIIESSCASNGESDSNNLGKKVKLLHKSALNALRKKPDIALTAAEDSSMVKFKDMSLSKKLTQSNSTPTYYDKLSVIEKIKVDFCQDKPERIVVLYLNHTQSGYIESMNSSLTFGKNFINHHQNVKPENVHKSIDSYNISWNNLISIVRETFIESFIQKINLYEVHLNSLLDKMINLGDELGLINTIGWEKRDLFKRYLNRKNQLLTMTKCAGMFRYTVSIRENTLATFFKLINGTYPALVKQDFQTPKNWDGPQICQAYITTLEKDVLNIDDAMTSTNLPSNVPPTDNKFDFLELCNFMFVRLLILLTEELQVSDAAQPEDFKHYDIGSRTFRFIHNVSRAIGHLKIRYPPGSLSAWAFCTTCHVLDMLYDLHSKHSSAPLTITPKSPQVSPATVKRGPNMSQRTTPNVSSFRTVDRSLLSKDLSGVSPNSHSQRSEIMYLENKANLYGYARQCLQEIGEVCGLMPDTEATPECLSKVTTLLSGLGKFVDNQYEPLTKLRLCLKSKEYYKSFYVEIAELSLISLKHLGRIRSAKLVSQDIAKLYSRVGDYDKAETFCQDILRALQAEGWSFMAIHFIKELLHCRLLKLAELPLKEGQDDEYLLTKIIPLYLVLATDTYMDEEERKNFATKFIHVISSCSRPLKRMPIQRFMDEVGTFRWIDENFEIDRNMSARRSPNLGNSTQSDQIAISLKFGYHSNFPLEIGGKCVELGLKVRFRLHYQMVKEAKGNTSLDYLNGPLPNLSGKRNQRNFSELSLKAYCSTRLKDVPDASAPAQHQVLDEAFGFRCENKSEVISSMYSPPPFARSSNVAASNFMYTFEIPNESTIAATKYLESEFTMKPGYYEYNVKFVARNNSSCTFTHLTLLLGDDIISFGTDVRRITKSAAESLSLDIRKVRPCLYFEFGKDLNAGQGVVLSPCEDIAPSIVPISRVTVNGTSEILMSPGLRSKGAHKVKPLAGVQQTWALILTTGDFNIQPGIQLAFTLTPGLEVKFPCLISDDEEEPTLEVPVVKFTSNEKNFTLKILKEIPHCHTLVVPCQFLVNICTSLTGTTPTKRASQILIPKKKITPYTFDHKIEMGCPWECSPIIQNLRFYQPFSVGHTVHACGPDKKYVQILVKCRTNEISFDLSQPELKCATPIMTSGHPILTPLNNQGEVLNIAGNQSASYVWLLVFPSPTKGLAKYLSPSFTAHKGATAKSSEPVIIDGSHLDLTFTIRYAKCSTNKMALLGVERTTLYTYLFDLVRVRTLFTVRSTLAPQSGVGDISFLKVGTPCLLTATVTGLGHVTGNDQSGFVYLRCRTLCDPALWSMVRDETRSDEMPGDIIKISTSPNSTSTFQQLIRPLTRGYFPAPGLRLYLVDRTVLVQNSGQLSAIDTPKSPTNLTVPTKIRSNSGSTSLSSFYRKCSTPFKMKSHSLSKEAVAAPSPTSSVSSYSTADSNKFTSNAGNERILVEKSDRHQHYTLLGPAQVYNASLGTQYQVLPPTPTF